MIEGLKALLADEENVSIVHSFSNGHNTLEYLSNHMADVILLDVNLPDTSGIELCKSIIKNQPDAKILGLSTFNEQSIIKGMIKSGARGYILKNVTSEELVSAISQVHHGRYYFSSEVQKMLANTVGDHVGELPKLTRREKLVLTLIADGNTTAQIAEELFISPLTVETHRRNLMKKLNVSNAAAMVKLAVENKLI